MVHGMAHDVLTEASGRSAFASEEVVAHGALVHTVDRHLIRVVTHKVLAGILLACLLDYGR